METKFRNIYNLYKNDLFRLAISYTKNVSDAEDVIQEVFIKLYKNIFHPSFINKEKTFF